MPRPYKRRKFSNLTNCWQRFRSQTGKTQAEVGAALGLGQVSISNYEAGRAPSAKVAQRFVELARKHRVRMSMEEIFKGVAASRVTPGNGA